MAVAEVHNWSWREVSGAGVEFQVESRFSSPGTGGVSGGIQIFLPRKRRSFRWNPDFPPLSGVGSLRRSWREVSGVGEDPGVAGGVGEEVSGAGEDPDVAGGVGWGQELV